MTMEFVNAAQHLADILAQENDALKQVDFQAAAALVPAKDMALEALTSQPRLPEVPQQAAILMRQVAALAAENQTLLERALAVQTRIIRIVARAGTRPEETTRYNEHGTHTHLQRATAMAVSTRV